MLKRLNRASSQLVANVSDYAIYTLDTNGRMTSWNLGAEKMILKGAALRIDPLHVLMAEPLRMRLRTLTVRITRLYKCWTRTGLPSCRGVLCHVSPCYSLRSTYQRQPERWPSG
jgi:hypothetical protein